MADAAEKILQISSKILEYKEKIEEIKTTYVDKINKLIEDAENAINDAIVKINSGVASAQIWLEKKLKAITKKIQNCIDTLMEKFNSIVEQLKEWYDTTLNNIKVNIIIAGMAKIGVSLDKDAAQPLADAIPHPDIASMIPSFELSVEIPELTQLQGIQQVSIPRIAL